MMPQPMANPLGSMGSDLEMRTFSMRSSDGLEFQEAIPYQFHQPHGRGGRPADSDRFGLTKPTWLHLLRIGDEVGIWVALFAGFEKHLSIGRFGPRDKDHLVKSRSKVPYLLVPVGYLPADRVIGVDDDAACAKRVGDLVKVIGAFRGLAI